MNETSTQLDADELLHFAIRASQSKEIEKAILYLKHALQLEPDNASLHYFIGAQHAELGMFDRAIEEMSTAVKINPDLETAHFQLGLLYATSARIEEANEAWSSLDNLGENNPLYLFKTGLLQLAKDDFGSASENLNKGIKLNNANPDLNRDMQRILDSIAQAVTDSTSTETHKEISDDEIHADKKSGNHIFLSAYNTDNNDDESTH